MFRSTSCFCLVTCLAVLCSSATLTCAAAAEGGRLWVYFAGNGIHLYSFNLHSGALEPLSETQAAQPSFLAIHPSGRFLYGAGRGLSAFSIDPKSGELTFLNAIPYKKHGLCHLSVDQTGSNVLSTSYGAGTVVVQRIEADGRLGKQSAFVQHEGASVVAGRQDAPHAHSVNLDAGNNFAFAADLGTDDIFIYRFNAAHGTLTPSDQRSVSLKPGAGPRHFAFHPNGRFAYVINELDSTVTAFRYDAAAGRLEELETHSTLPDGFSENNSTAEVVVHPSGRFLYGSNRGDNSIVVFAIDSATGKLSLVERTSTGGDWPRNFCVDPTGQFLLAANQKSNHVNVFRIDQQNGGIRQTSHTVEVPNPTCIRFLRQRAD